jgi:hypothetical protein
MNPRRPLNSRCSIRWNSMRSRNYHRGGVIKSQTDRQTDLQLFSELLFLGFIYEKGARKLSYERERKN